MPICNGSPHPVPLSPTVPWANVTCMGQRQGEKRTRLSTLAFVQILLASSVVSPCAQTSLSSSPISGAWRIVDVTQPVGANPPQTGFVLFTGKHYSIVRSDTDRPDFKDQSKVTPEEALVVWGA